MRWVEAPRLLSISTFAGGNDCNLGAAAQQVWISADGTIMMAKDACCDCHLLHFISKLDCLHVLFARQKYQNQYTDFLTLVLNTGTFAENLWYRELTHLFKGKAE